MAPFVLVLVYEDDVLSRSAWNRKTLQSAYSYEAPVCYRMFHTLVYTVTRKDDLLVKSALFDFLISTNRQL